MRIESILTSVEELSGPREEEATRFMDEDSFRAFYDRTARGLWAYLTRITGNRQLADDLVQESYYRFYRAGDHFESEKHRRNSLFCIATNLVRDAARRGKNAYLVALPEDEERGFPHVDEGTAPRAEGRTDLLRAMARLEPRQREMLWLAYAQGASHTEIAETLGLKTASIKALLFRARRTMARFLRSSE